MSDSKADDNNINANTMCLRIAKEYFDVMYNAAFRDVLGSVTEEEFEVVKKPEMFNIDMNYDEYIQSVQQGAPENEVNDSIAKIAQFLQEYVVFQEDVYLTLMKEIGRYLKENSEQVKQIIATNVMNTNVNDEECGSEGDESPELADEIQEPITKQMRMMTGTSDIDLNTEEYINQQNNISQENEQRGIFKVRISGKDIEVETYGNIILYQLYSTLFGLFCADNNMNMEFIQSEREKIYKSPLEEDNDNDSDESFSLILNKLI